MRSYSDRNVFNLVYLYRYKYYKDKTGRPASSAILYATLQISFIFMFLTIILLYGFIKITGIEPFGFLWNSPIWTLTISLPIIFIVQLRGRSAYTPETLESAKMTEQDYKRARIIFLTALCLVLMVGVALPILFGGVGN